MRLFAFFAFLFSFSSTLEYGRIFFSRGRGKKSERRRRGIRKRLDDGNARTDRMLIFFRFLSFVLSVRLSVCYARSPRSFDSLATLPFPSPGAPQCPIHPGRAGQSGQARKAAKPRSEAQQACKAARSAVGFRCKWSASVPIQSNRRSTD